MKLTRNQFENLKGGEWITTHKGTFEVTSPYDRIHNSIATSEVIYDDDNGENYHLEASNPYTTFTDVKDGELI